MFGILPVQREYNLELPPVRYQHEYHPTGDAKTNHDLAEAALMKLFSDGEKGTSTNVYSREWKIGFFTIRVMTWPRELNNRGHNSFEGKNPYLWTTPCSASPRYMQDGIGYGLLRWPLGLQTVRS